MSVTLDVSKLSGWSKPDAPCRVETVAYSTMRARCRPGHANCGIRGGMVTVWASGGQGGD
eukprot:scaffold70332_cov59-Phaeocystis_antarctica.AAC.2